MTFAKFFLGASALLFTACTASGDADIPADEASASAVDTADSPETLAVNSVVERELTLESGLSGAFVDAGDRAAAILIVPGSGPTDRDGNNPMGVRAATYKMLAEELSAVGISSLRVDKRGLFGSAAAGDPNAVTLDIYAQDYLDWASALREETGRDCVYLLGHSEGGLMVSAAAAQESDGICGLILVASAGRPLFDVLREQLQANPANAPILPQAMDALETLEAGERVVSANMHPGLRPLFAAPVQDFMISAYGVDPVDLLLEAGVPTLAIHPERDLQVSRVDAEQFSRTDVQLIIIEGANHVLKPAPEDRAENLATYADPDLPLADRVVEVIAGFVKG